LATHNVPTSLTNEDRLYLIRIFEETGHPTLGEKSSKPRSFEQEVALVLAVQDAALRIAPENKPIAFDRAREPRDLYEMRQGLCYDRSRLIEKALRFLGFRTRHASIYSTAGTDSSLRSLTTPQVASHALSEVLTAHGWMLVDSNSRWIGLTSDQEPISLRHLYRDKKLRSTIWHNEARIPKILASDFTYVIGLYSRHGRFYPPYTPLIPDISWFEVLGL
jgi:hypothetical protein